GRRETPLCVARPRRSSRELRDAATGARPARRGHDRARRGGRRRRRRRRRERSARRRLTVMSDEALPQIDFATFILSLSHSALMHLGEAPDPETQKVETDLSLAKQNIDILVVLEEKTKGNLTGQEERLLAQVLFDLKMRYVE